jgi:ribosomal protein L16 Arg81 hydroxylase
MGGKVNIKVNSNAIATVERLAKTTRADFYQQYILPQQPVVITDMMSHWQAMQKWSFEYFGQLRSPQQLAIEQGNVMQNATQFYKQEFSQYIAKLIESDRNHDEPAAYLSVFEIFQAFPDLKADVDFSLISSHKLRNLVYAWIGPKGTITGYHADWADNVLAQVYGTKRIDLVSPTQDACMYPSAKFEFRTKLSSIEPDNCDRDRYPLFQQAQVLTTILHPGEMIFIPRGWWHRVESLSKSISINNCGLDFKAIIWDESRELVKAFLHELGLYGQDCTCHTIKNGKRIRK